MTSFRKTLTTALFTFPALSGAADHRLNMDELVVHGSAIEETLPQELSSYGSELEVIEREQLDSTGVSDVGQALQGAVPGLFLNPKTGRGDYSDVSIQGSRSEDVLWLVDGVRINNRLFGSTSPLDSISTHMIERIEVLKGGQGLFYGTQAVAGVINIVLRQPSGEPQGELTGAVGTLNDRRLAGHVSDGNHHSRWLVFGEHDQSDGYRPYRDGAWQDDARRQKRGFNRSSYGGRYRLDAGEGRSLNALFIRNDVEADFPRPANNFKSVNDREEHVVSLKWDHQVTEQTGYFLKGYFHDWWTDYTRLGMDADSNVSVIDDRNEWGFEDYGLNLTGRHTLDNGSEILGGVDYQRYRGKDEVMDIASQSEEVTAGFVQFRPRLAFSPSTNLAIGARYNHADFGGDQSIWNISLGQPLPAGMNLGASLGTNFRLPSADELFRVTDDGADGNEDLEPEKSLNANAAVSGSLGASLQWRLGGFYREIEDLIGREDGEFINTDDTTRVRGGEAGFAVSWGSGWRFDANATYAKARNKGDSEQVDDIPEWFANASLHWDGTDRGWQLEARHTGDIATTAGAFGKQSYGNETLLDASAWLEFGRDSANRLTLRVENLTDKAYANDVSNAETPEGNDFLYDTLGAPRNAQLEYSRRF